ncbi:MAG: hypothetical protein QM498_03835 [Desulfobacterium sp.]
MKNKIHIPLIFMLVLCFTTAWGSERSYKTLKEKVLTHLKNPDAKISLCYNLEKERWTQFELPRATDRIKVITTANISKQAAYDAKTPMNYALEFQLLDKNNKLIKSGLYHHHTSITQYGDPAQGRSYTSSYYFDQPLVPGDGRLMVLDFNGTTDTKNLKMRFRLSQKDAIISDVVMRIYFPEMTSQGKLEHQWKRTGKAKKTKLAQGNIYSSEFLTEAEQINLIRRTWRPLAPVGTEGTDYVTRRLYVLKEIEYTSVQPIPFIKGIALDEHLRATLPIPEQGLDLRLLFFQPHSMAQKAPTSPSIKLKWFGKKQKTLGWDIPWRGDETRYTKSLSAGIMELSCDQPVTVLMYQVDKNQEIDITPAPLAFRVSMMDSKTPVTYRISHGRGKFTPFRAGFRKQMPGFHPMDTALYYTLLDEKKNVLKKEKISLNFTPSLYDRFVEEGVPIILSTPLIFYFKLSSKVAYIQFSSLTPLLVNAHNRPPRMVKLTRVPEDYYPASDVENKPQVTWFPLRPLKLNEDLAPQESIVIRTQPQPPEMNPDLFAGNFKWESFEPGNNEKGHYLLVPSEKKSYQRDASLGSNFKAMALNRSIKVNFKAPGQLRAMNPRLIFYQKNRSHPFNINVTMDGTPYYEEALMGATGSLTLPSVSPGNHAMTINTSAPIKAFVNLIQSRDAGYHLRFAHPLTPKGMTLDYTKVSTGDETLSLALFFPRINAQRLQLKVTIKNHSKNNDGPFKKLTLLKRRYSVRSDDNGPVYVLNASTHTLGSWQQCFAPLGSDLKPGRYTIGIVLEKGPEGYLVPYRVTPGSHARRKLFREAKP